MLKFERIQMFETRCLKLPVNKALFYVSGLVDDYLLFKMIDSKYRSWGYTYKDEYDENPYLKKVHPVIKTLHYLDEVKGFTHEGGFGELYSYEFGFGLWQCLQGLYEIGEHELLTVICFAIEFFEKSDKTLSENDRITQMLQKGVSDVDFGLPKPISYTNLKITSIKELNELFDDLCDIAERKIVHFIKQNPNQFVVDEKGLPFDENFTGVYENRELEVGYILSMQNGKPHGKFEIFDKDKKNWVGEFDNGFLKSQSYISSYNNKYEYIYEPYNDYTVIETCLSYYENQIQIEKQQNRVNQKDYPKVGLQQEWYADGTVKEIKDYFDPLNHGTHRYESYYENGQLYRKGLRNGTNDAYSTYYYKNGQKHLDYFYDEYGYKHITAWSEEGVVELYSAFTQFGKYIEHRSFYPNGDKKEVYLEYTRTQKPNIPHSEWLTEMRQAWDENGNQTVIDGNGTISKIESWNGCLNIYEYQNGLLRVHTEFYETGERRETYFNDDEQSNIYYEKDGSIKKW